MLFPAVFSEQSSPLVSDVMGKKRYDVVGKRPLLGISTTTKLKDGTRRWEKKVFVMQAKLDRRAWVWPAWLWAAPKRRPSRRTEYGAQRVPLSCMQTGGDRDLRGINAGSIRSTALEHMCVLKEQPCRGEPCERRPTGSTASESCWLVLEASLRVTASFDDIAEEKVKSLPQRCLPVKIARQ